MTRLIQLLCTLMSAVCCMMGSVRAEANIGAQLLSVTNEMWFLLTGVVDKGTADAASARFAKLAEKSSELSDKLFDEDAQAQDVEALDQNTYRIAEAYEDLSYEFESLCRARCYGSDKLVAAFVSAMRLGVFSDEHEDFLQTSSVLLSERSAIDEIKRLRGLIKPDNQLLLILARVHDPASADAVTIELCDLAEHFRELRPKVKLRVSNFPEKNHPALHEVCSQLEPLLWKIRSEIVRVVALPGYDHEQFDTFSDALDLVFENLSDAHSVCFEDVFDASFRSDLDDALHESLTNSP